MPASNLLKDLLIATLGFSYVTGGCRSPVSAPVDANVMGVAPSKGEGQNILPIVLYCARRPVPEGRQDRIDLSLYLEYEGRYTAYVRQSGNTKAKSSPVIYEAVLDVRCSPQWHQDYKYGQWSLQCQDQGLRPRLDLIYFPTNALGMGENTGLKKSPWQGGNTKEPLDCRASAKLIPASPKPEDTLTVIGSAYDPRLKVHYQVVHQVQVDLLSRTKDGDDLIMSLSNQIPKDQMPLGAPVFDAQGQLAGYVKEYNPGEFLSLIVYNIHGEKTRELLERSVRIWQRREPPPADPKASARLLNALCQKSLGKSGASLAPGVDSLGTVIQTHCRQNKTEVY